MLSTSDIEDWDGRTRVLGLLLIDGFALLSYAAFVEPFRAANILAERPLYSWVHISDEGPAAMASNGAEIGVGETVVERPDCDAIFVFAGGDPAGYRHEATLAWLRRAASRGVIVGGVSGGPFILARAGLLEGCRVTVHWEHRAALQERFPDLDVVSDLYVIERRRVTCAGGTAGLDLAVHLIASDHGPALARRVAEWFIEPDPRQARYPQRVGLQERYGVRNARVLKVLEIIEKTIEDPPLRAELAAAAGVSIRQIERLFKAHLGATLGQAMLSARLDHADYLLQTSPQSVIAVALACGFKSGSHFSRMFRRRFGRPPGRFRSVAEARWS